MFKSLFNFLLIATLLGAGLLVSTPSHAQQNFCKTATTIEYGQSATGRLDANTFAVAYCFTGEAGDTVVIEAEATSGNLDTFLVVTDPAGETILAENDDIDSTNTDSQITYTLPESGMYLILVSRFGGEQGTSSGRFRLALSSSSSGGGLGSSGTPVPVEDKIADPSEVVTITCDTGEVLYGGVQFTFININPGFSYTVTVFGLDDFDPVVAVETEPGIGRCNDDDARAAGSFVAVPGEGSLIANRRTAQVRFSLPRNGSPVITVGSFNGQGGRFVMVIEGLAISPATEADGFILRVPEAITDEPLSVYMISRFVDLDPYLQVASGPGLNQAFDSDGYLNPDFIDYDNVFILAECDDAGQGTCAETPALPGGGVAISNGSDYVTGRVDAGIQGTPETSDPFLFVFSSYQGRTRGTYAIVVMGAVPSVRIQ